MHNRAVRDEVWLDAPESDSLEEFPRPVELLASTEAPDEDVVTLNIGGNPRASGEEGEEGLGLLPTLGTDEGIEEGVMGADARFAAENDVEGPEGAQGLVGH